MKKMKKIRTLICCVLVGCMALMTMAGCSLPGKTSSGTDVVEDVTTREPITDAPTVEVPTTEEPTTEEPTTEEPTTEEPETTKPYVGPWTLLSQEPLNPTTTGYAELDGLVADLLSRLITDDMNNYQKVWAVYEYLIDNIQYNRGMDNHTGEYSTSDPSVTPVEILWASDLLNSGLGCCYNYSAALLYCMRALGYNCQLVTGSVPSYHGGTTPHCWVLCALNGEQYTFDPDLDMNYYTREKANGVAEEDNSKERFFCAPIDTYSYFYIPETYHTN